MHISPAAIARLHPTQALAEPRALHGGPADARSSTPHIPRRPPLRGDEGATGGALGTFGPVHPERNPVCYGAEITDVPEKAEIVGRKQAKATLEWEARRILREVKTLQDTGNVFTKEEGSCLDQSRKALNGCREKGVEHPLVVQKTVRGEDGEERANHAILGLFGCGSMYCPHCADLQAAVRAADAQEGFLRWTSISRNHRVMTLTLTIPNAPYASRKEMVRIVKGSWRRVTSDRGGEEFRAILNHSGWLRVMEIMHKVKSGTCHPHFHIAIFFELSSELGEDEIIEFNLEISKKIHALWEKKVRSFVSKERGTNPEFANWMDLSKDIVQKPYIEEVIYGENKGKRGRIKGGVVAEICENTEAFARYVAKELAYTGEKLSRGGESVSWQGLLRLSYEGRKTSACQEQKMLGEMAGKAFIDHILCTYKERNWEWSRGKDRRNFLNNLRDITIEPPKDQPKKLLIVADGYAEDFSYALKNDLNFYRVLDKADLLPLVTNLERETHGAVRNVSYDEKTQERMWERFEKELKEAVSRMQEYAARKRMQKKIEKELGIIRLE